MTVLATSSVTMPAREVARVDGLRVLRRAQASAPTIDPKRKGPRCRRSIHLEAAFDRAPEIGGPDGTPVEYSRSGRSWKVYVSPPLVGRGMRRREIGQQRRAGRAADTPVADEPVRLERRDVVERVAERIGVEAARPGARPRRCAACRRDGLRPSLGGQPDVAVDHGQGRDGAARRDSRGRRRRVGGVEPVDRPVAVADPDRVAADGDRGQAARRPGSVAVTRFVGAIDTRDGAVGGRHPDRVRVEGECGRARVELDRRGACDAGDRIEVADRRAVLARHPEPVLVGGERDGLGGHADRLADGARRGVDADDRAVGRVGHPQPVAGRRRSRSGRCRPRSVADDAACRGIDPRHGPLAAVGDPDGALGHGDALRASSDVDDADWPPERPSRSICETVSVAGVGHPGVALADGDAARPRADRDLADDLVAVRDR